MQIEELEQKILEEQKENELKEWRKVPYEKTYWYEYRRYGENGLEIRRMSPAAEFLPARLKFGWDRISSETNRDSILSLVMSYFERGIDV